MKGRVGQVHDLTTLLRCCEGIVRARKKWKEKLMVAGVWNDKITTDDAMLFAWVDALRAAIAREKTDG